MCDVYVKRFNCTLKILHFLGLLSILSHQRKSFSQRISVNVPQSYFFNLSKSWNPNLNMSTLRGISSVNVGLSWSWFKHLDRFRHYVIPTIVLRFNWLTILSCFNQDCFCAWSEIGAWVAEKPQVISDLDFDELTWILQDLNILLISVCSK